MADRLKDNEDRLLEALLGSAPIADDGFTQVVVRRIGRRLWLRRLALPVAALVGGAFAVKPATELIALALRLSTLLPRELLELPAAWLPSMSNVLLGGALLAAVMLGIRMLEEF